MLKETLFTYVLPVLIWGGLTGIINLAFGYRSQIEAWAEANPRLAAVLKFTRGIGLDPWHLLSALKLFAEKKLPDAQKSDSPIAKAEQRKADAKRKDDEPPTGDKPVGPWVDVEPEKTPPSLPGARLVGLLLCSLLLAACPGNTPPPKAPCDAATLTKLTAECSLEAYQCGAAGIPKNECAPMIACNQKLDERKEQCR